MDEVWQIGRASSTLCQLWSVSGCLTNPQPGARAETCSSRVPIWLTIIPPLFLRLFFFFFQAVDLSSFLVVNYWEARLKMWFKHDSHLLSWVWQTPTTSWSNQLQTGGLESLGLGLELTQVTVWMTCKTDLTENTWRETRLGFGNKACDLTWWLHFTEYQ